MINLDYVEGAMSGLVKKIAADCRKMASGELGDQIHRWGEKLTTAKGNEHAALQMKIQIATLVMQEDK